MYTASPLVICQPPSLSSLRYNSGNREFSTVPAKYFSFSIDGFTIAPQYWSTRKGRKWCMGCVCTVRQTGWNLLYVVTELTERIHFKTWEFHSFYVISFVYYCMWLSFTCITLYTINDAHKQSIVSGIHAVRCPFVIASTVNSINIQLTNCNPNYI